MTTAYLTDVNNQFDVQSKLAQPVTPKGAWFESVLERLQFWPKSFVILLLQESDGEVI
jgi:hypothetical protein